MTILVFIRPSLIFILILILSGALHYVLPQVDVVRVVGVEIKRVDISDSSAGGQRTRDVYYLQTETLNGKPRVYRNEDNFIYGKFNSANLQAQMQSFASEKKLIALRHYGWRVTLFSAFPNAVKAWPVEEGYYHIPYFNTIFLIFLAGVLFFGFRSGRRLIQSMAEKRQANNAARDAHATEMAQKAKGEADKQREAEGKKQQEIDEFLNRDGSDRT